MCVTMQTLSLSTLTLRLTAGIRDTTMQKEQGDGTQRVEMTNVNVTANTLEHTRLLPATSSLGLGLVQSRATRRST